jgi:hypothetical protein
MRAYTPLQQYSAAIRRLAAARRQAGRRLATDRDRRALIRAERQAQQARRRAQAAAMGPDRYTQGA